MPGPFLPPRPVLPAPYRESPRPASRKGCAGAPSARFPPRCVFWGSRPAQSYGGRRGAHGESGERGGPRRAGNSLRVFRSDVRRRSPGAAVEGEDPRPDGRGADAEGAAAFSSASDGLGPACPRGVSRGTSRSSLLKIAGPSLGFTSVTPEPHRPSLGAAAEQVPALLPHFIRSFSTAGNPARGQPAATEQPPLRPDGPASPPDAPRAGSRGGPGAARRTVCPGALGAGAVPGGR